MDQTKSSYQEFFRQVTQRRKDASLDRSVRLCVGSNSEKGIETAWESSPNSPDFERKHLRKSSNKSIIYRV
jgi:hypothetical protein